MGNEVQRSVSPLEARVSASGVGGRSSGESRGLARLSRALGSGHSQSQRLGVGVSGSQLGSRPPSPAGRGGTET